MNKITKTVTEKVFSAFGAFAKEVFDDVGEPQALALVVDWGENKLSSPAGMLVSRTSVMDMADVLAMAEQFGIMATRMLEVYKQSLEELKREEITLSESVAQKQQELKELEQKLSLSIKT